MKLILVLLFFLFVPTRAVNAAAIQLPITSFTGISEATPAATYADKIMLNSTVNAQEYTVATIDSSNWYSLWQQDANITINFMALHVPVNVTCDPDNDYLILDGTTSYINPANITWNNQPTAAGNVPHDQFWALCTTGEWQLTDFTWDSIGVTDQIIITPDTGSTVHIDTDITDGYYILIDYTSDPGSYFLPEDEQSDCQVWFSNVDETNGSYAYHIKNNSDQQMHSVQAYGSFCNAENSCYGSATDRFSAGISCVTSSQNGFTSVLSDNCTGWDTGEILEMRTKEYIEYVDCTYADLTSEYATTPLGKTMTSGVYTQPEVGVPNSCQNLNFTIPLLQYSFSFPNWGCTSMKFFNSLLGVPAGSTETQVNTAYDETVYLLRTRSPLAYVYAVTDADYTTPTIATGSPSFTLQFAMINTEYTYDDPTGLVTTWTPYARNALKVVIWIIFVLYLVMLPQRLFPK